MCGIAGFANLTRSECIIDTNLLGAMHQRIAHRGPDGAGVWASQSHQVGFSHRRLSIIDLSQAGAQPMHDADGSVVITYNGEIYNYKLLRAQLEGLGHSFRSHTDTEVLLYAYKQWGIAMLDRLDGMFAFALFDRINNELYFARDRIGIKPLYLSMQGGVFSFASEIKALWTLPWIEKSISKQAAYHYLTYLATPAPMTLYEGIYKMPPGYYAKIDAQKNVTFTSWYDPARIKVDYRYDDELEVIDSIRAMLRASIEKRMMADVPFGVFLSGGIDSSLNVALMAEYTSQVKTFNVSFSDGPEYAETQWARKVAKQFATDHHEIVIQEEDAFNFFEKMVHHQDEPLGDCVCVPLYFVAKLLKDSGVTVVQVGEGSDELFCGYNQYSKYLELAPYWKATQRLVPAFAKHGLVNALSTLFPRSMNYRDIATNWATGNELFFSGAVVFPELQKNSMQMHHDSAFYDPIINKIIKGIDLSHSSYDIANFYRQQLVEHNPNADAMKVISYLELKHRLPELLLMRVDKMAMATSVEARVPFLDHRFVEYVLNMPQRYKYHGHQTKYILKKAAEGILPHEIIYRKKMGFAAPTTRWFKQGKKFPTLLADMLATKQNSWGDILNMPALQTMLKQNSDDSVDYSYQLWAVQNLLAADGP